MIVMKKIFSIEKKNFFCNFQKTLNRAHLHHSIFFKNYLGFLGFFLVHEHLNFRYIILTDNH